MARLDLHGDPLPPFALARLGTVRWRHGGTTVDSLVFSRDGGVVFAAGGGVTAIDVATGAIRWRARDPAASQVALLPAPDGDRLAAVGHRGALSLYAAADGSRLSTVELPSTLLTSLAVSRDGRTIFAGGFKPYGALLERDGSVRAALPVEGGSYLNSGVFSPDDATLVTTDVGAGVALWSVADARRTRTLGRADLQPNHTAFTPDGRRLVVAACDGGVTVFDLASGEEITRWKAHRASAHRVAVTPDGLRVVIASEDGEFSLWRLADGVRLATRAGGRRIPSLALCPDGATVAYSVGPRVALVDLATFYPRRPLRGVRRAQHLDPLGPRRARRGRDREGGPGRGPRPVAARRRGGGVAERGRAALRRPRRRLARDVEGVRRPGDGRDLRARRRADGGRDLRRRAAARRRERRRGRAPGGPRGALDVGVLRPRRGEAGHRELGHHRAGVERRRGGRGPRAARREAQAEHRPLKAARGDP